MHIEHHRLSGSPVGTVRELQSWHFQATPATPAAASGSTPRKVYIQAALHADELPGMLVAHELRQQLQTLEARGALRADVVVVPVANPIGLAQTWLHQPMGRFDAASGENFNRHYAALGPAVWARVKGDLDGDATRNAQRIRTALRQEVSALQPTTELGHLRKTLLSLACDAHIVLDLHCDGESLMHLYTSTPLWPRVEPLARWLGARATLLAMASGDHPFDEACASPWWQLAEQAGPERPVLLDCVSVTVELRGQADVGHAQAQADARALLAYLSSQACIDPAGFDDPLPPMPPLQGPARSLAAVDVVTAPISGVVVHHEPLGHWVRQGDVVLDVIDPLSGQVQAVRSRTEGLLLARAPQRYVQAGQALCKVVGEHDIRAGKLSSA